HRSVGREVRPVAPVLAFRISAILRVVLFDEAIVVAPNGLHDAGPRIPNADIARFARAGGNLAGGFIVNDRIDAERARTGAAWLHRVKRRNCRAEEPAVLGLPPRVNDDRLAIADDVVRPAPRLRL